MFSKKCLIYLIIIATCYSCGSISSSRADRIFTVENGVVPNEFASYNGVLLVLPNYKYNKSLIRNVEKYYNSNFEIVNEDDKDLTSIKVTTDRGKLSEVERNKSRVENSINSISKYDNIGEYRFVLSYKTNNTMVRNKDYSVFNRDGPYLPQHYIYDRKEKKIFYCNRSSSFYNKILKAYILRLNRELEK